MNFFDLCTAIHQYITRHFNKSNADMITAYSVDNIQHMIRQKRISQLEFFLTARKSLDAMVLLDSLHFYSKMLP